MPRQRITKEMVITAAFEVARHEGIDKVMVKTIADKLGCSVQPIYSYCNNMDDLRSSVALRARSFIQESIGSEIDRNDLFGSTGRAYVHMAKTEPHLFRLFVSMERENVSSLEDLYQTEASPQMADSIAQSLKISKDTARQLHMHMLIYTIGIGTIFSVTASRMSEAEIIEQQEKAYQIFLKAALEEQ